MNRRLYLLFPDVGHAKRVVDDLIIYGIRRSNIHSIARNDIDISALPPSSVFHKNNYTYKIEHFLWTGNLIFFFVSLLVFLYLLITSPSVYALIPLVFMLVCYYSGKYYATKIPHAHLSESRSALEHHEILLLVDVPQSRVWEIEQIIQQHHPEAVVSGVGWSMTSLQI